MLRHASAVRPATSALDAEDNFDGGARSPGTSASLAVSPIRPLSHLSLPLRPIFGLYFRDGNAGQAVETSQGYRW